MTADLGRLATAATAAQERLQAAAVEAVREGQPLAEVARMVGVTRQTVYRWVAASSSQTAL